MRQISIEKYLIQHCSPTLAGIKTAGLFGYFFNSELALTNSIYMVNRMLNPKGIQVEILRILNNKALIFVYRPAMLRADLEREDTKALLKAHGYWGNATRDHIERLKWRLSREVEFPHEIGLFLGYPLHDVIGFIRHKGQNSKCSGCWEVYCDEAKALKLFAKYKKCRDVYSRLFSQGRPIERLIVAA